MNSAMQLLKGQTAIITGATRGIGLAIARLFAENGANLVINGTNIELINQHAADLKRLGVVCLPLPGDISSQETSQQLTATAMDNFGRIDCLINNSGILFRRKFTDFCEEEWKKVLAVNLDGMTFACKHVLDVMTNQGYGKIVNVLSSASKKPHPNASIEYGVSKAGGLYLTRHLALEYAPLNIHVNAICPGPIATEMVDSWDEDYRQKVLQKIPLGRLGKPMDVANAALFLASHQSDFITGEAININGGSFMD